MSMAEVEVKKQRTGPEAPAAGAAEPSEWRGFDPEVRLEDVRTELGAFAAARDWNQFHTPRNLLCALVGEVGELSEIFQWRGEVSPGLPELTAAEKTHVGEEMSDILCYLIRMADRVCNPNVRKYSAATRRCEIDLAQAVRDKIAKNNAKYPADKCRGSAAKYTEYHNGKGS